MTNLRESAITAIRTTVLTWMMLSRRSATRTMECLNSIAIKSVMIMPNTLWNTLWSRGLKASRTSSVKTMEMSWNSDTMMMTAITADSTSATTCSKRS